MVKKLSQRQVAAIKFARKRGKILAQDQPELADEWKAGVSYSQLSEKYIAGISRSVGKEIIAQALKRLIPKEERSLISYQHKRQGGFQTGKMCVQTKAGIYGLSKRQKTLVSQMGKKASLAARGIAPYDGVVELTPFGPTTEEDYIKKLIGLRQWNKGYTWKKIAEFANAVFGNNRNWKALRISFLYNPSRK